MNLKMMLSGKELKTKQKVLAISQMLLEKKISINEIINEANESSTAEKATCIEAMEFATKINPGISTVALLEFVIESLMEKAPRVKWESAKVIGNIIHLYPGKSDHAINNLLTNSEHAGTVVRWSAAFALGEIVKLKAKQNKELIPAIESIIQVEENNAIKKIYLAAVKNATD